jgi:hypothetical protein
MVYKRVVANLRAQNWLAICIELAIVIFGVFIGTQVANWNEERLERRQTQRMLIRLQPELDKLLDFHASARSYYRITRAYATTAFAGWQGEPTVSDRDFVIAAYQASQIYATPVNGAIWATIFGADRLHVCRHFDARVVGSRYSLPQERPSRHPRRTPGCDPEAMRGPDLAGQLAVQPPARNLRSRCSTSRRGRRCCGVARPARTGR